MIGKLLSAFIKNERGNFAMIFGLSAIPMIVGMGMGIDFYTRLSYKARFDAAADAASIAAVKTAQAYMVANAQTQSSTALFANAQTAGEAQAVKVFSANAGLAATQVPITTSFNIKQGGVTLTGTTTYSGTMHSNFGPLIGLSTIKLSGSSVASLGMTTYLNYYVLIDVSGSMGIGATAADMANLYTATAGKADSGSCVFGCHGHYSSSTTGPDYEAIAHSANPPITLRIDSARTAVLNMITQAQQAAGSNGNIQIGLYTMTTNAPAATYVQTLATPTTNFSALTTAANTIDLALWVNNGTNDPGYTDADDAITALAALIPAQGNGLTQSTPINYAFIVSDGLQDVIGSCDSNGHCPGPVSLTSCATLKTKANVGTIYTTYLPIYNNNNPANGLYTFYSQEVGPYASKLMPNMQSCASQSNLFFQASNGATLISAMQQLFANTTQPVALSH